jgi:hypothetical protein
MPAGLLMRGDEACLVGEHDCLSAIPQAQFGEDARDVCLHVGFGRVQAGGDFGVGPATADQPQHLDLALGQLRRRRKVSWLGPADVLVEKPPQYYRCQQRVAGGHGADCGG